MAREMTPQERAAAPVEVRQALANKVKNLIVSNLTHEENQLWLANVDAFEERAYQRGRRAALLEVAELHQEWRNGKHSGTFSDLLRHKLAQEG